MSFSIKPGGPTPPARRDAKRIFRGLSAQKNLCAWAASRGVDLTWIAEDKNLSRDALKEALHWKTHDILAPLLKICRNDGYKGLWYYRALLRLRLLEFTGKKPSQPSWLAVKPRFSDAVLFRHHPVLQSRCVYRDLYSIRA